MSQIIVWLALSYKTEMGGEPMFDLAWYSMMIMMMVMMMMMIMMMMMNSL